MTTGQRPSVVLAATDVAEKAAAATSLRTVIDHGAADLGQVAFGLTIAGAGIYFGRHGLDVKWAAGITVAGILGAAPPFAARAIRTWKEAAALRQNGGAS